MCPPNTLHDFAALGKQIAAWLHNAAAAPLLSAAVRQSTEHNPWFTAGNIRQSLAAIAAGFLDERKLHDWLLRYAPDLPPRAAKRIGVVMAGNIPLVGFHDFLCVLASGHCFIGKCSHKDKWLLPALWEMLCTIRPAWRSRAAFVESVDTADVAALIATGADAAADFFARHFAALPHLIRRNRRSAAVLTGDETPAELQALSADMLSYFGLGCRSVSLLYVPQGYAFDALQKALSAHADMLQHAGYAHNYHYQKALLTLQKQPFIDTGVVLLHECASLHAPLAAVHYGYYAALPDVQESLSRQSEQLQCIVGRTAISNKFCTFGTAQQPALGDYADGTDTLQWLLTL